MDDWTDDQYRRLVKGGNSKWRAFWEANSSSDENLAQRQARDLRDKILLKYESNTSRAYRGTLSIACSELGGKTPLTLAEVKVDNKAAKNAPTPAQSPTLEAVGRPSVVLAEESPPSLQSMIGEVKPFVHGMVLSRKVFISLSLWGLLGMTGAYGVYGWGLRTNNNGVITSSLPSVNPATHGQMGTAATGQDSLNCYHLCALGIISLTVGIPCFLLHKKTVKISHSMIIYRQDAFKSARNLLTDRIAVGRAQRMDKCDVYYPAVPEGGELKAKIGFVFFPGALVDRAAYAPVASRLSESGILVAVANLEPCRAVLDVKKYNLKENVMHMISDALLRSDRGMWTVEEWAIGGHSAGGTLAMKAVADEFSSTMKKVVLWGVLQGHEIYGPKQTLRDIPGLDVLVINGSEDGIVDRTPQKFEKFAAIVPPMRSPQCSEDKKGLTHYVTLEGGNHSGCAHYGPQTFPKQDGTRLITLEQQQRQTVETTAEFLLGGG